MSVNKPFHRIVRQYKDGTYHGPSFCSEKIIRHSDYAKSPEHYQRAWLLIQKDLLELFDYIEPADKNLNTFSYRIHALMLRTCVEIEANFKAILNENTYSVNARDMNMGDYKKVNKSHRLSSYKIAIPNWNGKKSIRHPFKCWADDQTLDWYRAYNNSKHDRLNAFEDATFENLIDAISGLLVVISAQFETISFSPNENLVIESEKFYNEKFYLGIGNYFYVHYPEDWDDSEKYEFDASVLESGNYPFEKYNYDEIN